MGAFVSRQECQSHYNVTLNCTIDYEDNDKQIIRALGDIRKGEFEGDADIAGIGIFATFIGVTSFALTLSFIVVVMGMVKHRIFPFQRCGEGFVLTPGIAPPRPKKIKPGFSEILQGMVLSCSDAQIFTGAAYALTLRYFRGCVITAYHYNIVANLMLLTCATHLMAITVVRDYWEFAWLAVLRVICKTGVFLVTGLLLSNQNANLGEVFPTKIPQHDDTRSPLFLAAACFQSNETQLQKTLEKSLSADGAKDAFLFSSPGNRIEGWNKFLIILLWYTVAVVMEIAMFIRRGNRRDYNGIRKRMINAFWRVSVRTFKRTTEKVFKKKGQPVQENQATPTPITRADRAGTFPDETSDERAKRYLKWVGHYVLTVYYLGGIGICMWTVAESGKYVAGLRDWVQGSGWLEPNEYGLNPENDATSFGQLVPIFTSALVLFTFLEMFSSAMTRRRDARDLENKKHAEDSSMSQQPDSSVAQYTPPPRPAMPETKPEKPATATVEEVPLTPDGQPPQQGSPYVPSNPAPDVISGSTELGSTSPAGTEQPTTPRRW
ncbi:hypothetical protein ACJ41O_001686 [Fusarium nematophilum]